MGNLREFMRKNLSCRSKNRIYEQAQHPKQHFYQIGKKINFMSKTSKLRAKIPNLWETITKLREKIDHLRAKYSNMSKSSISICSPFS
jgi:uncharacterized coiled-coil DUF342 family protein